MRSLISIHKAHFFLRLYCDVQHRNDEGEENKNTEMRVQEPLQ